MQTPTPARTETYLKIALGLAIAVLLVLCGLLVREYGAVRRLNNMSADQSLLRALRERGPVGVGDAGLIAGWMTFDYIDHLFDLSPAYLETALAIHDSRYPRLTLDEYAEDAKLGGAAFLAQVQDAVRAYAPVSQ